jgi:acyl-CoA thioester hydrolase
MAAMSERRGVPDAWPDLAGRIDGKSHVLAVRVYYEDTDFSGIVYHANYLRYCERGRSDFLRLIGVHHSELFAGDDRGARLGFAVTRMDTRFRGPARIDDVLEVRTVFEGLKGARFDLAQSVSRGGETLFEAELTAALVDGNGRPRRLPEAMRTAFAPYLAGPKEATGPGA